MIQLEKVSKVYNDRFQALKDINLTFEDEKINVLIGPSGCGKTTTMKMLNRLIEHTDGNITIDGQDLSQINTIELRRQTGYVIQNIGLFPHMTIYENVATVPKLLKWDKKKIYDRVEELLNLVNLDFKEYKDRYPSELSGGQQQRVGVIRALAAEPSTILMDEPFSALDPISREQLQDELVNLQKDIKKTIVFVTHDMDEALKIADNIILMNHGEVIQQGTPEDILANPKNDFVKEFIGIERIEAAKELPPLVDFVQEDYPYFLENTPMETVIDTMLSQQIAYMPIVDNKNVYIGFVDLYKAIQQRSGTLADVLTESDKFFMNDSDTNQVIKAFNTYDLMFVPIVTSDHTFVGVLNKDQLMRSLHELYESKNGGA